MKKRQSQLKYQSRIYNVQRKSVVDHRGMKMIWNNKLFPSLNAINGKTLQYATKGILRHYHYQSDKKLGPGIVEIIIIPCSCHDCTTILSIYWYSKIKETVNQHIYGIFYNCRYSQTIDCRNNWILTVFNMMEQMKNITK